MPHPGDPPPWPVLAELLVSDPAAVQVLWHPTKRLHLRPFLGRSAGLAEAAQLLGIKKTAMSYWVGRLLGVGLIRLVRVDRSSGHKVPRYRCVADRLRVHLADAPMASHEAVFDDVDARWHPLTRQALARSLTRQAPHLDLTVEASGAGGMATHLMPRGAGAPRDDYIYYRGRLWLTRAESRQLQQDIDALWDKYAALSDQAGKPSAVLIHLVTVPEYGR